MAELVGRIYCRALWQDIVHRAGVQTLTHICPGDLVVGSPDPISLQVACRTAAAEGYVKMNTQHAWLSGRCRMPVAGFPNVTGIGMDIHTISLSFG